MCNRRSGDPRQIIADLRSFDAERRAWEAEQYKRDSIKRQADYDWVVKQLRPATLQEYQEWMVGHIRVFGRCGLQPINFPFSIQARRIFVVSRPVLELKPLLGALALTIIVPAGVSVEDRDGGHNTLLYMKNFRLVGEFVFVYSDMEF